MKRMLFLIMVLASILLIISGMEGSNFFRGISSEMVRYQGMNFRTLLLIPCAIILSYFSGYIFVRSNR